MSTFTSLIAFASWMLIEKRLSGPWRVSIWLVAASASFLAFNPFSGNSVIGSDSGLTLNGLVINTNGRAAISQEIFRATGKGGTPAFEIWFGRGSGAAAELSRSLNGLPNPLNEYLRIFTDLGWMGLVCLAVVAIALVVLIVKRSIHTSNKNELVVTLSLGGILALTAVTEGAFSYTWFLAFLGLVLGINVRTVEGRIVEVPSDEVRSQL